MKDWNGGYNSVFKTLGARNNCLEERETNDYYATDPMVIDKLLTEYKLPQTIYECACGAGHLAAHLSELGYNVHATDLIDRGYGESGVDFLTVTEMPSDCTCILTNPPYKFATEFVTHSLDLLPQGGVLALFLKTSFLEGKRRREEIFDLTPPRYLLQFSERVVCAKNGDFERMKKIGSAVAYAWYIWEKGYKGNTEIKWI